MPWTKEFKQVVCAVLALYWAIILIEAIKYPELVITGFITTITAFLAYIFSKP